MTTGKGLDSGGGLVTLAEACQAKATEGCGTDVVVATGLMGAGQETKVFFNTPMLSSS
jgi:hypothetical protein